MTDQELTTAILEAQERARARAPQGATGMERVILPNLMPLVHARDAAQGKIGAIGTVNPRPPGLKNTIVQMMKRWVARALDWHVREQVEFNRAAMECVQASLEALNATNRSLAALSAHAARHEAFNRATEEFKHTSLEFNRFTEEFNRASAERVEVLEAHTQRHEEFNQASIVCVNSTLEALDALSRGVAALSAHTARHEDLFKTIADQHRREIGSELEPLQAVGESLAEFEQRAIRNEIHVLRTISELQAAYQHRLTVQEETFRGMVRGQHADYLGALDRSTLDIQKRLWDDLVKVRQEFERLIHQELRMLRQKSAVLMEAAPQLSSSGVAQTQEAMPVDWLAFASRFRGSEDRIRKQQDRYISRFTEAGGEILDVGCGRGEFLEAARDAGLTAYGIDSNQESVDVSRGKGLEAECADLFAYLESRQDASISNVYCAQVVEHLSPPSVARFVALLGRKMNSGSIVAIETPNPECLAIFATYFYIDPTHTRPVPAALLRYYLQEAGFVGVQVEYLEPAEETIPALADLPASVREALFGGLDYAIFARKL